MEHLNVRSLVAAVLALVTAMGGTAAASTLTSRADGVDLVLTTSAGAAVVHGDVVRRTLTATNRGSEAAVDVHVAAWLPAGVRVATVLPVMPGGTCTVLSVQDGRTPRLFAECRRDRLAPGATAAMVLDLEVTPDAECGSLVTLAETGAVNEPAARADHDNRGRVVDRLSCPPLPGPDLAITMTIPVDGAAAPDSRFVVHIVARNRGDAAASDVEISADFPDGTRPLGFAGLPDGCTVVSSHAPSGRETWAFTCRVGALEAGAATELHVRAFVVSDPACGPVGIHTEVSASNEPKAYAGADNRASRQLLLGCRPSVRATSSDAAAGHEGDAVAVRVPVTNVGGGDLLGVRARAQGCDPGTLRLTEAGDGPAALSPGETWVYGCRRTLRASDPSRVAVTIAIEGRDRAGTWATDRGTFRIDVLRPSISLDVVVDPSSGTPGGLVTAWYAVRNTGNTTLRALQVRDPALGVVGTVAALSPGATRTLTASISLPATPGTSTRTVTVAGSDRLGRVVQDSWPITVTVLSAFTDPTTDPGSPGGGTAFSGSDVGSPATASLLLLAVGVVSMAASRRRRFDT